MIHWLEGSGHYKDRAEFPLPKLIFLDLKMPAPDGFEVLKWKATQNLDGILWVAMSNFDGVKTINQAYADHIGADGFAPDAAAAPARARALVGV